MPNVAMATQSFQEFLNGILVRGNFLALKIKKLLYAAKHFFSYCFLCKTSIEDGGGGVETWGNTS